jgi:hypothetical protein
VSFDEALGDQCAGTDSVSYWVILGGSDRLLDDDDLEKLTSKMELEGLQDLCNSLSVFGISR